MMEEPALRLHSTSIEDDGETLILFLDTSDGDTLLLSLTVAEIIARAITIDTDGRRRPHLRLVCPKLN